MIKAFAIAALILVSATAQAEDLTPWFGGTASPPEQIATNIAASLSSASVKNPDCPIFNCATLVKVAKPEQKNAANP